MCMLANFDGLCAKVFMASADKTVHCWDLGSNQKMQVAQHDAPVKTVHWIKAPTYSCVMTGSWDKTLKVLYTCYFLGLFKLCSHSWGWEENVYMVPVIVFGVVIVTGIG